jgi:hypothetical protein
VVVGQLPDLAGCFLIKHQRVAAPNQGESIMAKHKKESKVQKRAKPRRGRATKRGKAHKAVRAKAVKRTVAKAKPKRAPMKKAARRIKRPVAPVIETGTVGVIEQPAPSVIIATEDETPE